MVPGIKPVGNYRRGRIKSIPVSRTTNRILGFERFFSLQAGWNAKMKVTGRLFQTFLESERTMQIQVHTDGQIHSDENFIAKVKEHLQDKLKRYEKRIMRLEVYFHDENSSTKKGDQDKRCQIEARLNGLKPLSASDDQSSVMQALSGATKKLEAVIESALGKLEDR
jgi:ribosome-associated translation inhibitor RaiA